MLKIDAELESHPRRIKLEKLEISLTKNHLTANVCTRGFTTVLLIRFTVPLVTWLQIFMTNMSKINIPPPKIETV